ncbi:hypothetical protein GZ77_24100 [Endozoicomonas montiporae]|uniref:Glycosyltransferase 2-like domain-containing protein n=2 Tax=Endozoicomonas montiporae TaxID=1027273 RepID=A0A081MZI6_9GAMM|nr:glycosyltransferase family A protein [Endozoicomonas montiporae]AMO54709.1 hypothetical protein EZMO1_0458 [Endozoicomonas montiporae CL-33]KEQ11609.1 hypothetical protein GZ77_24100 [Endozoicomonas montiporae]
MSASVFSEDSEVTVVITSCGRFDLLKNTLDSFFKFNTYPIKKIIITEDSGDDAIHSAIPEQYKQYFTVIVNKPKLGQIRSIDKAYSLVDTSYIFHCEDDWDFYRTGFIEDSLSVLKSDSQAYQVWLRSFYHDVQRDYPFHSLGDKFTTKENTVYYRLLSSKEKWQGFSFNPGLRRTSDYLKISNGYSSFFDEKNSASLVESSLSKHMTSNNMYAAILENDAVAHTGYESHISDKNEKKKKRKKKIRNYFIAAAVFSLGIILGNII